MVIHVVDIYPGKIFYTYAKSCTAEAVLVHRSTPTHTPSQKHRSSGSLHGCCFLNSCDPSIPGTDGHNGGGKMETYRTKALNTYQSKSANVLLQR